MNKPTGYSVSSFGEMILNEPRMSAYSAALRAAITPGCTVIDIGAGTGIFSLLACKFGAGHVTAIEAGREIEVAGMAARDNGMQDRLTLVHGLSTEHVPERKADVIVSDIRGTIPYFEHHIATIRDARDRLLAPGGTLIPMRDTLHIALAHAPESYRHVEEPWLHNAHGLDLRSGHRFAANNFFKVHLERMDLVSDVAELAQLDYRTITEPNLKARATLRPEGTATAHGLLMWFDTELAPGIGFSNAPGQPQLVYGQTFLPFERPITLAADDRIEALVDATLMNGAYVLSWRTAVYRGDADTAEITMSQSSFKAEILDPANLATIADSTVPARTVDTEIHQTVLSLIDGTRTLGDIAQSLRSTYPDRFASDTAALSFAAGLCNRKIA